jgi:hypothetical protein
MRRFRQFYGHGFRFIPQMVRRATRRVTERATARAAHRHHAIIRETIVKRSALLTKFLVAFLAVAMLFTATAAPKPAGAQSIGISVSFGPPPIPYYVQPPAPYANMIWSPGYWAYDPADGYYWVPGTWVPAPEVGLLWTPGYWGWNGISFIWTSGYWAPQVGWYGGVDYGYGYYGNGYVGGRWNRNVFVYNTSITNVNRNVIRNVYSDPGVAMHSWNRVSYNGGRGGIGARPTAGQLAVAHQRYSGPTTVQTQHARYAATNRASFAAVNHGRPATAAVARPYTAAYRAPQRTTAPQRYAAPQAHYAAPQAHYAAPQAHYAAPQAHYAAPQAHYAAPQAHYAAPQAHNAAPQAHYAAPGQHAAPAGGGRPAPGGGRPDHQQHH